ncbi:MAG: alpha/beta hydrolase, partial [Actinobacteria bacterium]|nr:alpha/beta hydrolase [Actinomycetota bacterium]
ITIIGMSFGFLVVARMLQRYPDIAKKTNTAVSIAGFVHHEDFKMGRGQKLFFKTIAWFFSYQPTALFARYALLNRPMIQLAYWAAGDKNVKMKNTSIDERKKRVRFEVKLWQCNDVRTYCATGRAMLRVNLFEHKGLIDTNVTHIRVAEDRYFDNHVVEQHLGVMFKQVTCIKTSLIGHAPTVIATAKEAAQYIPKQLRTLLKSS